MGVRSTILAKASGVRLTQLEDVGPAAGSAASGIV